jgi:hypothetical protein
MQLLGKKDSIEKPIIKANGISIAAVSTENSVGDIATCQFIVPVEFAEEFKEHGKIIEIKVESDSANGTLFKGKISGCGFSNMVGSISCRVDLVHELASKLDSSSTLFPGNMPGSAMDRNAYIKMERKGSSKGNKSDSTVINYEAEGDFVEDINKAVATYITSAAAMSATEMKQPEGGSEIIAALNKIESHVGGSKFASAISVSTSKMLNEVLKGGSTSSTFWNVLSTFFGEFDIGFICKNDGGLLALPNMSGVISDGHEIPEEWVMQFDQSSRYERTPKKVVVLSSEEAPYMDGTKATVPRVGQAEVKGAPKGASGEYCVEAPRFLRGIRLTTATEEDKKEVADKYAELIGAREIGKLMQCSVICPLILDVFPGVSIKFKHASSIKTYSGDEIPGLKRELDGYCWKIRNEISTDGAPKTMFSISSVTDGSFPKINKHPFWSDAKPPKW